jgi:hypothetical protein
MQIGKPNTVTAYLQEGDRVGGTFGRDEVMCATGEGTSRLDESLTKTHQYGLIV